MTLNSAMKELLETKTPYERAVFNIKLQPFYMTLHETCKELNIVSISLKGAISDMIGAGSCG